MPWWFLCPRKNGSSTSSKAGSAFSFCISMQEFILVLTQVRDFMNSAELKKLLLCSTNIHISSNSACSTKIRIPSSLHKFLQVRSPAKQFSEYSIIERYLKTHITQHSQCFIIRGHYHWTRFNETRFLCTGVVSSKLAQPLIQRKNDQIMNLCETEQ